MRIFRVHYGSNLGTLQTLGAPRTRQTHRSTGLSCISLLTVSALLVSCSGRDPAETEGGYQATTAANRRVLLPTNMRALRGFTGDGQFVGALHQKDQAGTEDRWLAYVDFSPFANVTFRVPVPADVQPKLASLALRVNYRGYTPATMRWFFDVKDQQTGTWVRISDNAFAQDWVWTRATFPLPLPPDRVVKNGAIVVRYWTASGFENSFLDELVVVASLAESPRGDAGVPPDSGTAGDSGVPLDGGIATDAGRPSDADGTTDAASSVDAGNTPDENGLRPIPDPVYGVTIDAVSSLSAIVDSLSSHRKVMTTRIVFDEFVPASDYRAAVNAIYPVSFIMGEILDSFYVRQYSVDQYRARTVEYLDTLQDRVDIWEVGNEINGEWLGDTPSVVTKMSTAFDLVEARGLRSALTLYYNEDCWESASNEMFRWTEANVPSRMRSGLDYVWVSYYEDDCNGLQPNWEAVFARLATLFPNSKIGIGECGTTRAASKAAYLSRYYNMNVSAPRFVGGHFWWYYKQDMVPRSKALWSTLDNLLP